MELLAIKHPKIIDIKKKIKEVESSIWYTGHGGKNCIKVASIHRDKNCSNYDSSTHKPGTAGVNFHTAVNIRTKLNFVGSPKQIRDKTDRVNKAKNKKKTK